jgi:glucose-6-phosphate 1-epimerase
MLDALRSEFAIAQLIDFQPGNGGLTKAVITSPLASGELYLNGAHVTHYQPAGQAPVLFVSGESKFVAGKAIRGGVPICFPWFGPLEGRDTAPAHGFARTSEWKVKATRSNADASVTMVLELEGGEDRSSFWPHAFKAQFVVTFGQSLRMELTIMHVRGEPFMFEEALHTYFHVGDVREVSVTGLGGTDYLDKTQANRQLKEDFAPIRIVGETDRIYLDTVAECVIDDAKLNRRIIVEKTGSDTTVLWNPWIAKSKALSDFGDDEWPAMLCIETCNVGPAALTLAAGQSHTMTATIRIA